MSSIDLRCSARAVGAAGRTADFIAIVGQDGTVELPHNAFVPRENDAVYTRRTRDEEDSETHTVKGADEYQVMVEHFADAVLENTDLFYSPDDSIANMRVLDALAEAARTGKTVSL